MTFLNESGKIIDIEAFQKLNREDCSRNLSKAFQKYQAKEKANRELLGRALLWSQLQLELDDHDVQQMGDLPEDRFAYWQEILNIPAPPVVRN